MREPAAAYRERTAAIEARLRELGPQRRVPYGTYTALALDMGVPYMSVCRVAKALRYQTTPRAPVEPTDREREVLDLRLRHGLLEDAIARQLRLSPSTVKTTLRNGKARLLAAHPEFAVDEAAVNWAVWMAYRWGYAAGKRAYEGKP